MPIIRPVLQMLCRAAPVRSLCCRGHRGVLYHTDNGASDPPTIYS